MKDYAPRDFERYYMGAWFLHPKLKIPCKITGRTATRNVEDAPVAVPFNGEPALQRRDPTPQELIYKVGDANGRSAGTIDFRTLTFEDFCSYPDLGYRHTYKGRYLFYLTKRSMRRTEKGVRPDSLLINTVPEVKRIFDLAGKGKEYDNYKALKGALLEELFAPSYLSLDDACKSIVKDPGCVGLALSADLAITCVSTKTTHPYLLLFKQQRAAVSTDCTKWKATHPEYAAMLRRHFPNIRIEDK